MAPLENFKTTCFRSFQGKYINEVALIEPEKVFENIDIALEIKAKINQEIKKRLEPKTVKIKADFELKCFTYEVPIKK